VILIDPTQPTS